MYNEWLDNVEIGIHPQQPSPHPGSWVAGGDNYDRIAPYVSCQKECVCINSAKSFHFSFYVYNYNKWLYNVEIRVHM